MAPRRVLSINPGGLEHGGGIGRMIGYMIDGFRGQPGGPRIEVVDSRGPGRLDIAPVYFAAALARVVAGALRGRPLLHVHLAGRGSTLRKVMLVHLAALVRLRVLIHLHDYDYSAFLDGLPGWALPPVASMFHRAHAVVTLGSKDRALVRQRFCLAAEKVVAIPNAVPRPPPRPTAAGPAGEGAPVRLLFLGDPSRRKGVHDLMEALDRLARDPAVPPWRAVIAGGGRELEGFRAEAERRGLAERVALPGWLSREAAHARLADADLLVLPSYAEGLAMSVLEAMSHGLAIVCTPVGALAEAVENGVSALLVQPGDVDALTAALQRCIADPALRSSLGAAAQKRFGADYALEHYSGRIQAAYALAEEA